MAVLTRHEAEQVLARHGVETTPGGADLHTLATAAAAHGWLSAVERIGTKHRTTCYQAMVWTPTKTSSRSEATPAARRRGGTAAEALGLALATMLARQERFGPRPSNSR